MGESQKSKRITWASEVNLCQVRMFSSTKPPSEVGMINLGDESLPPGFEYMKPKILKICQKSFTKWKCPPRFEVNREWHVVSGEESTEIEAQSRREGRVFEATYPRPSAIPPNPRLPANAPGSIVDDRATPQIRMTPIEEDDDAGLAPSVSHAADSGPMMPQPQHRLADDAIYRAGGNAMRPNIAQAALAAVGSNKDQMNLIDCDLLMRILSNPKSLQQLLTSSFGTQHAPNMKPHSSDSTKSTNGGGASVPEINAPYDATRAAPPQLRTGFVSTACSPPVADVSSAPPCAGAVKDMSYYKSLIQLHGGSGGGVPAQSCESAKSRDVSKSRTVKPCMFFNTPRGCRNGANCAYQHDVNVLSSRKRMGCVTDVVGAKRVKLGS
ncbi:zinc finger CCCH domain-containing protein 6-like isoform X1 [Salvia divinorum]|uniref:Zinc finger CCCH domain-containing protein 6-like isoform X1 n=1 Tax=Salvia divinorum TaxID=28513 RepID=A0ABD1FRC1_SALDI